MKYTTTILITLAALVCAIAARADAPKADLDVARMKKLAAGIYEIPDSHGVMLTLIEAGKFQMGSGRKEVGRLKDETQRKIEISRPFYIGIMEITQAQYMNAMHPDHTEDGINKGPWGHQMPAFYKGGPWGVERTHVKSPLESDRPMDMLTWEEAMAYCKWLNKREAAAGRLPKGYEYRLPTEAEWEYACRAGSEGQFGVEGEIETFMDVNAEVSDGTTSSPIGRRKANPWGLYDMHGSLYEWVMDWYGPYDEKQKTDPVGPAEGAERVMRGGSYASMKVDDDATEAEKLRRVRSASRSRLPQDFELPIVGMRLALAPAAGAAEYESRKDHKEYDFHYDIRYPGRLRSDVGRDKVTQKKARDLKGYHRREVKWWPKRGVDFTPLEDIRGAPLRTWTPRIPKESFTQSLLDNFPTEPFKAHLVNFRGVGDDAPEIPADPTSYRCPAVVLRLEDGRKRIFLAKYLSEPDRQYIMQVYNKDMERISKTLLQDEYAVPDIAKAYPEGMEHLHKHSGKIRFDTKHASIVIPGKAPADGRSWVREEQNDYVLNTIAHLKNQMEAYWAYHEYSGALVRYWERPKLFKYVPQFGAAGGGGGGGYGGCDLRGPGIEGVFHEWGHGMLCGGLLDFGGAETAADSLQVMGNPANIHKTGHQIEKPWKGFFHGCYPGGGGYEILADDPNWGYAITAITSTLAAEEDTTPMHVYAHLGVERGLWSKEDAIRGMGDLMGQIGARLAEFDCQQEYQFRTHAGAVNRSFLVPVDAIKGIYRCPTAEAPDPFGVSISRLVPNQGAKEITVDFKGDHDPETHADWRACIVAVDKNDICRYSPLWNKGEMSLEINPGDKRFWLTVTATPKALMRGARSETWVVYQGAYTYRYPYQVTLSGAKPGPAYATLADNNNMDLSGTTGLFVFPTMFYGDKFGQILTAYDFTPHLTDTERKAYQARLEKQLEAVKTFHAEYKTKLDRDPDTGIRFYRSWRWERFVQNAELTIRRIEFMLENLKGAPHPNGGGWVSAQAEVAPTAYVGPNCYVMGKAQILDRAQLIESAAVIGDGTVIKDNAKISGKAQIIGDVVVEGFSRIYDAGEIHRITTDTETKDYRGITRTKPNTGTEIKRVNRLSLQGPESGNANLLANYEILRDEPVLLENLMRLRDEGFGFLGYHAEKGQVNHDGFLVGRPGFDGADDHSPLVFNGKDQHAEISCEVIDLGELMIVMRVKVDASGKPQTLFDFGSSLDNRMTLTVKKGGELVLQWTVKGKSESLSARKPLVAGEWATIRVEIDGRRVALHVDESAAEKKSDFRSAYVYAPQFARRNLVFRSRDEKTPNYAAGQLDYLRVYSEVAEDFAALPSPPTVSPNKAMPAVFEKLDEEFGGRAGYRRVVEELYRSSTPLADHVKANDEDLLQILTYEQGDTPEAIRKTLALRDAYYALKAEQAIKQHELKKQYFGSDAVVKKQQEIKQLQEEIDAIRKDYSERRRAAVNEYREAPIDSPKGLAYKAWQENSGKPADPELAKKMDALNKEAAEIGTKIKTLREAVVAPLKPQQDALSTQIARVKTQLDARAQQLTEDSGPVAAVFAAVLKEADEKSKRELQRRRDEMLHKRGEHGGPPTGFLHDDMPYAKLWYQLQDAQRREKAGLSDALLKNKAYIDASIQRVVLQEKQHVLRAEQRKYPFTNAYTQALAACSDREKTQPIHKRISTIRRSISAGELPYMREHLGEFVKEVETAKAAWENARRENATKANADKWKALNASSEPWPQSQSRRWLTKRLVADAIGPDSVDDLKQLRIALKLQDPSQWLFTTDDWKTEHKLEEDFENKNKYIHRWMKRIKPYR